MNVFDRRERQPRRWQRPEPQAWPVNRLDLPLWLLATVWVDWRDRDREHRARSSVLAALRSPVREPVFIVGAPRSGTSFLGDCVGAIDSISYHREPVLTKAATRLVYTGEWSAADTRCVFDRTYRVLRALQRAGDRRVCEKDPGKALILPQLAAAFPDLRVVHIVRDPRDVVASILGKPWYRQVYAFARRRSPDGYVYGPFARFWTEPERREEFESTSDAHRAAWVWRAHATAASLGGDDLATRFVQVRYEDLVHDPVATSEHLAKFLAVDSDAERDALTERLQRASAASIGLWRTGLRDDEIESVRREAGRAARSFGYDLD
jgi:hypothetical protein